MHPEELDDWIAKVRALREEYLKEKYIPTRRRR
jgi:hypothetical protein